MPALALTSDEGRTLCFLLVAGGEPLLGGPGERECILTGPPQDTGDFDHPLVRTRYDHLHVEHRARVAVVEGIVELVVPIPDGGTLEVAVLPENDGTWRIEGRYGYAHGRVACLRGTHGSQSPA